MSSLFNNKQQKLANKYSKSMKKATKKGEQFVDDVLKGLTPETIYDSFEIISNKGHEHEKKAIIPIAEEYRSGNGIDADQLLLLNDLFTAITTRLETNGDE